MHNKEELEKEILIILNRLGRHRGYSTDEAAQDILELLEKSAELPSDEEIVSEVSKLKFSKDGYKGGVIEGMIWMRDKIKGGDNENS